MVGIRPLFVAILVLALVPASSAAITDTRIIVKRQLGLTAAERADIRADADVRFLKRLPLPRTEVVVALPGDVGDALRDLNADPDVVYAERDRPVRAFAADPDECDPYDDDPANPPGPCLWGVDRIFGGQVDAAWNLSQGARRTVAVIDSGIDAVHPDLVGQVGAGYDFYEDDADPQDPNGHGTHVAGTIAATRENGTGVVGVAPAAKVVPLRALDEFGDGFVSDIIAANDWAGDRGIPVVNESLGAQGFLHSEYESIQRHPETLYVVAAGNSANDNDDPDTAEYPCAYGIDHPEEGAAALENILCVGATDEADLLADFSNFGATSVDLYAPGVDIRSTYFGSLFYLDGTSMATPHVAAAAALLAARDPSLSTGELKQRILDGAQAVTAGLRLNAFASLGLVPEDIDGDGVLDATPDNCPTVVNPGQEDDDIDGTGNACEDGVLAPDRDLDGVDDLTDECPDESWDGANGCPVAAVTAPDDDHDGVENDSDPCPNTTVPGGFGCLDDDGDRVPNDGRDNCPTAFNPSQADLDGDGIGNACDSDVDGDLRSNGLDNCRTTYNPDQANADGDTLGDACDPTPRGPDNDADGVPSVDDACPDAYGTLSNGCPAPLPAPPPDSDGDGRTDATDGCPIEPAISNDGCPIAQVAALSARVRRRAVTIVVKTTRLATVTMIVERRKDGRWVRVARRTVATLENRATGKVSRLKRGRHRVRISVSSNAGAGTRVSTNFRVR